MFLFMQLMPLERPSRDVASRDRKKEKGHAMLSSLGYHACTKKRRKEWNGMDMQCCPPMLPSLGYHACARASVTELTETEARPARCRERVKKKKGHAMLPPVG